ncbi:hypothetical protein MML48_7g00013152 [Holotrichia oblita]|uniref:Uncharacterized protein n=1 Tax=Holotrichia oblita TaxID=644536 RepID=A0ACB9SV40_HOLOL|nr:hypothetical protein MML48_7g00013152 [Holotrichia oblita]
MPVILKDLQALHDVIKVFKSNISKDSLERRRNIDETQKKITELDSYEARLNKLKVDIHKSQETLELVSNIKTFVKAIDTLINECRITLQNRLEIKDTIESFSLKTANSLVPSMDSSEDTTKKSIHSISLYADLINPENKAGHLIKFILKTRLSENTKIRLDKSYDTVEDLL